MDKTAIVNAVIDRLKGEVDTLELAARAAYEAATHPESAAEDQYDTRGLEASYLAGAQTARLNQLRAFIGALRAMPVAPVPPDSPVRPGTLVAIADDRGERSWVLVARVAGGVTVTQGEHVVRVITPESPLGAELVGREPGDDFEVELTGGLRGYSVVSVH